MIRFYKPTLKRNDMDCVLQTMADEHIGPGERARAFTRFFADSVGCAASLSFRTYQDCIRTAFDVAGLTSESRVAISPLAPSVYYEVLSSIGCDVVYVDVDTENGMPGSESVISSGADVFVLYESCGSLPAKYSSDTTLFEKVDYSGICVIEDISESIGSAVGEDLRAGSWGNMVLARLEEYDVVSAGGGAVLAAKGEFSDKVKDYKVSQFKSLSDLNAALGLVQLENIAEGNLKRSEICSLYQVGMVSSKHKKFGLNALDFKGNGSCFSVFLDCKPDELIEFAKRRDVPVIRTFENSICSCLEGDLFEKFPTCAAYYYRTVSFPVYPFLKPEEVKTISRIVANLP